MNDGIPFHLRKQIFGLYVCATIQLGFGYISSKIIELIYLRFGQKRKPHEYRCARWRMWQFRK